MNPILAVSMFEHRRALRLLFRVVIEECDLSDEQQEKVVAAFIAQRKNQFDCPKVGDIRGETQQRRIDIPSALRKRLGWN